MAKRKGKTCVLFKEVPDSTSYRKDNYSWVQNSTAEEYIEKGYGVEYDPAAKQEQELEPVKPETDIPEDFPGGTYFKQADIMWMDEIKQLREDGALQSVDGIGDSTQTKIENYLGD